MNNFVTRTITGILFVAVLIGCILLGPWTFAALFLLVSCLGLIEFYRLVKSDDFKPDVATGTVTGILLFILVALTARHVLDPVYLVFLSLMVPVIIMAELFRKNKNPFGQIGFTLLGVVYVVGPFALLNFFYNFPSPVARGSYGLVLGFFVILWLYDTGAYLSGMALGRHPLFERISPKKTWEGVIGGSLIGLAASWALSLFFTALPLSGWLTIAVLIIFFSTFGDLSESMLKRSLQRKDSGTILPGHGGILDRFDGVLFASPMVFLYLFLFFK